MKRFLFILLISVVVVSAACLGTGENTAHSTPMSSPTISSPGGSASSTTPPTTTTTTSTAGQPLELQKWNMSLVWNVNTVGIPFMDLSPDGNLGAVLDWNGHTLYLVKPDGSSVSFDLQENDIGPVIAGVAIKGGYVYVLGDYGPFTGIKTYSWNGKVGEVKVGSAADGIMRSPSGNHLCYLVTLSPTEQSLTCDGKTIKLNGYSLKWVSDSGLAVTEAKGKSVIFRDGSAIITLDSKNVLAYGDKLIVSENNTLKILSLDGKVLAQRENAGFGQTVLLKWTLLPTKRYIFRHEPLEDTHVLTWNLTEIKTLPGFPYFANENFVVTAKDGIIHCYSLKDFHEVFSTKVPGDSLGYIKLSNDGKVMLLSGETGSFWLYVAG